MKKQLSFSNIKYKDLKKIAGIKPLVDDSQFETWFSFDYKLSDRESNFLKELIVKNRIKVTAYTEEELKAKFIIPLLNQVNFVGDNYSDWYERTIKTRINGWEIGGVTDFMVAKGEREPELPYFFIQEFKPSKPNSYPEEQLVAALLTALNINKESRIKGAYIVGQHWYFVIVEKIAANKHAYYVSQSHDSLKPENLMDIYKNLQAVKADILFQLNLGT